MGWKSEVGKSWSLSSLATRWSNSQLLWTYLVEGWDELVLPHTLLQFKFRRTIEDEVELDFSIALHI